MKDYNSDALEQIIKLAKMLTCVPMLSVSGFDDTCCAHCGALGDYDDLLDESIHKDYCAWRFLKEAVANLYNPGYSVKGD